MNFYIATITAGMFVSGIILMLFTLRRRSETRKQWNGKPGERRN